MADPTTINESIEQNAVAGVQNASSDGVSVTAMDIEKQIKAKRFLDSQTATANPNFGFRFAKIVPGGGG